MGQHSKRSRSRSPDPAKKRHKHRDRSGERDKDRKHKSKSSKSSKSSSKSSKDKGGGVTVVDEDYDDDEMWVEKNVDTVDAVKDIPTAQSLKLTSNASSVPEDVTDPPSRPAESKLARDEWMLEPVPSVTVDPSSSRSAQRPDIQDESLTDGYGEQSGNGRNLGGGIDFFASMGTEKVKKKKDEKPDPDKPFISSKELNRDLNPASTHQVPTESSSDPEPSTSQPKNIPGGPGSQWRMMRLRRVYESAAEDNLPIEQVAIERFGTLEAFEEAKEERRILDERDREKSYSRGGGGGGGRGRYDDRDRDRDRSQDDDNSGKDEFGRDIRPSENATTSTPSIKGFMYTDPSSPASVQSSRSTSFRRPGATSTTTPLPYSRPGTPGTPGTPSPGEGNSKGGPAMTSRVSTLRLQGGPATTSNAGSPLAQSSYTPVRSVMTPQRIPAGSSSAQAGGDARVPLSNSELNKLQARVLRAKLTDSGDADKLQKEYDEALRFSREYEANGGGARANVKVEVLPTLDGRGNMYDVGTGSSAQVHAQVESERRPGNKRKKEEKFDTHDKTGSVVRYNANDDTISLGEMLRQEKMSGGGSMADLDREFADRIMRDGKFENDLDYIDDNAGKLARQKMRTDAMKRQFAVHDYKRTQQALSTCPFCYQATGSGEELPPSAPVIAMGTRVYLSCTMNEELVKGHCLIVPMQHCLCVLEGDDDVWEEVKNFAKTLMQYFSTVHDKGVVFYETVTPASHKYQKHSFIECVPVPWEVYDMLPGYFKESLLSSESEWSQNKKLIDFSTRKGGFRRMMVPKLPYFMVMFDYKGEKGLGHVIEGGVDGGLMKRAKQAGEEDPEHDGYDDSLSSGPAFPSYFAGEIIANVLEIEDTRLWRRPKKVPAHLAKERVRAFREGDKKQKNGRV